MSIYLQLHRCQTPSISLPLGGKGERFVKSGFCTPKALIPIYGKPMIFHVIDNLVIMPEDNLIIVYNNALDEHNFATCDSPV